jgi:hypothetical protein
MEIENDKATPNAQVSQYRRMWTILLAPRPSHHEKPSSEQKPETEKEEEQPKSES